MERLSLNIKEINKKICFCRRAQPVIVQRKYHLGFVQNIFESVGHLSLSHVYRASES